MSTNYYLRPAGACADRCSNWLHLGKTALGSAFMFRAYPPEPPALANPGDIVVTDFAGWVALLDKGEIHDEYGRAYTKDELVAIVEARRGQDSGEGCCRDYLDADGNWFIPGWFS